MFKFKLKLYLLFLTSLLGRTQSQLILVKGSVESTDKEIPELNLETGNALQWANKIFQEEGNPFSGTSTLYVRHRVLNAIAVFDALAPFTDNAVGVVNKIERRPEEERTLKNKNLAILHALAQLSKTLAPKWISENSIFRRELKKVNIDPDLKSDVSTSPEAIGITAGQGVQDYFIKDGLNQNGDDKGKKFHLIPYEDTTDYEPVNPSKKLVNPTKWQPLVKKIKGTSGQFYIQRMLTPQMSIVKPITNQSLADLTCPPYGRINESENQYKIDADDAIATAANLTDQQKVRAEFFDTKFPFIQPSLSHVCKNCTLEELAGVQLAATLADHDALIPIWKEKIRYDAVRPLTAIRFLYKEDNVTSWGGPRKGTVDTLPADQWRSYLGDADHPEYPSSSTCICAAHAHAIRKFRNSDELNLKVTFPKGSSGVEPGLTPQDNVEYLISTWSQFEKECGESRVLGGVHFRDTIANTYSIAHEAGDSAVEFVKNHLNPSE